MFMFMHCFSTIVILIDSRFNSVLSGMLGDLLKVDFAIIDAILSKIQERNI